MHFGLGPDTTVEKLIVEWPSGRVQTLTAVPADQFLTLTEPTSPARPPASAGTASPPGPPRFQEVSRRLGLEYTGTPSHFDEFARQPLLPRRLSGLGPGIAIDPGTEEGKGVRIVLPGAVFTRQTDGRWTLQHLPDEAAAQATTPLLFEANGDGVPDLYLASGDVARRAGAVTRDRLFFGRPDGTFVEAPAGSFPANDDCTGPVAAVDFDGDGQLDLFVGGRMVPGKYPEAPRSRLLRNDHGRFTDVTEALAPELRSAGMVTAALWTDVDNDRRPDLLVATEWGPVRYFHNEGGRFAERTEAAGLSALTGWWTSLEGADVNGDGLIDYVVGNVGLNTKYHASPDRPMVLYSGDLDGSGKTHLVEAWYEGDRLYPVRGRSKTAYAMPSLRRRFRTFASFAAASMEEIFGAERLASARRLEAAQLASGVLLNHGGRFTFEPLPTLAQLAPLYGLALHDFDGDGFVDLVAAQNFFGPEPKTGRFDGGCSLLLRGDGRGGFRSVWPLESGLIVPGDAKGLATLDWNQDGRPDLLVTQNAGKLLAFENQAGGEPTGAFSVRLKGPSGNPTALGARIQVRYRDGHVEGREIHGGAGHLSESAPTAFFGGGAVDIVVLWPDGRTTRHRDFSNGSGLLLSEP